MKVVHDVERRGLQRRRWARHGSPEIAHRAAASGALRCFRWSRRALPVQVLGLGAAGVAQKFGLCAKTLMQETDPDDLDERRLTIAGWLADQGTELAIGDCPYEDAINFKSLVTSYFSRSAKAAAH